MSAEAIAKVVRDLARGTVVDVQRTSTERLDPRFRALAGTAPVIDATTLYRELGDDRVDLYADHLLRPPLPETTIAYVNAHGNVVAMHVAYVSLEDLGGDWAPSVTWDSDAPDHEIDWDRVRWVGICTYWVGGRGGDGPVPTFGPVHLVRIAVHDDGTPADIRWHQLIERPVGEWNTAMVVMLRCLTFLNCRNVVVAEPTRQRAERRRVARYGVVVNELRLARVGKWARTAGGRPSAGEGVPLTTVRGHLARYGIDGRGLLFGKYAGEFWIPAHARGRADLGEHRNNYLIEGDSR